MNVNTVHSDTMSKSEKERLKEAEKVAKLREKGLTYQEIADEMDIGKSTAHSRMKLWEEHLGSEPADEEEVEEVKDLFKLITEGGFQETIEGTVGAVLGSKESAQKTGRITGADVATLKNALAKFFEGKIEWEKIKYIANNIEGIREGLKGGDEVSEEVLEAISERKKKEEKEKKKEKAVAGGGSEEEED